jgi:hypothetical protein
MGSRGIEGGHDEADCLGALGGVAAPTPRSAGGAALAGGEPADLAVGGGGVGVEPIEPEPRNGIGCRGASVGAGGFVACKEAGGAGFGWAVAGDAGLGAATTRGGTGGVCVGGATARGCAGEVALRAATTRGGAGV